MDDPKLSDAALMAKLLAHDRAAAPALMARIEAAAKVAPAVAPLLRLLGAVAIFEAPVQRRDLAPDDIEEIVREFSAGRFPMWGGRRLVPLNIAPGLGGAS